MIRRRLVPLAFLAALACSSPGAPALQLAPVLDIIAGDGQTDTVAKELPVAVTARALEKLSASPMPGVVLNWFKVSGADSVFVAAGITNAAGEARMRWTLGTKAGTQGLVAWALDEDGRRTEFAAATATALPGPVVYAGFVTATLHVLSDSVVTLPIQATDAYGNAVASHPPVVAIDDTVLVEAGGDTWRAARLGVGRYRLTGGDQDTIRVAVYAPVGTYRAERTVGDSLFVETGTLVLDRIGSAALPADWAAYYHVINAMSVRTYAGAPPDTMRSSQVGERTVHRVLADTMQWWPVRLGPTGYQLPQGGESPWLPVTLAGASANRWRFTINGVGADSLVITR